MYEAGYTLYFVNITTRSYCETTGLSAITGPCDAGWYCLGGAEFAQPVLNIQGGRCEVGNYCPSGSSDQVPCTAGKYCASTHLAVVTGDCDAGYECRGGAETATPTDGTTGNL